MGQKPVIKKCFNKLIHLYNKAMKKLILSFFCGYNLPSVSYSDDIAEGKKLTFDRKKGNCLACHMIDDGELAGNNGPPLLAMKARFPDREVFSTNLGSYSN